MIPTYRIQTDSPHADNATATVFFINEVGDIKLPGITVPITPDMTFAQAAEAADAMRKIEESAP